MALVGPNSAGKSTLMKILAAQAATTGTRDTAPTSASPTMPSTLEGMTEPTPSCKRSTPSRQSGPCRSSAAYRRPFLRQRFHRKAGPRPLWRRKTRLALAKMLVAPKALCRQAPSHGHRLGGHARKRPAKLPAPSC
ncbi:MAG: hypothetical protein ACLUQW_09995 [Collinsella sp.]